MQGAVDGEPYVSGSLIGRVLALLGLLFFILPPVGLAVSLGALALNWKVRGWPKKVAWTGIALSTLLLLLIVALDSTVHP